MFDSYVRVNFYGFYQHGGCVESYSGQIADYKPPKYIEFLIDDCLSKFAKEYLITTKQARLHFHSKREHIPSLAQLLSSYGISVIPYGHEYPSLPSCGLIFNANDPKIVEFKLKYGS